MIDLATATHSWEAVGVIASVAVAAAGGAARWVGKKVDQVGEHLERQDDEINALGQRVARLEGIEKLARDELVQQLVRTRRRPRPQ